MALGILKQAVKGAFASPAGWRLSAPLRGRGVVVLMYHRINAGEAHFPGMPLAQFREQMQWIRANCTPIHPEAILEAAPGADRARPPVAVTFDDGYRDYHDTAYPVLRELGIPAAVFLSTDFRDRGGLLWTEAIHWAGMRSAKASVRTPWSKGRPRELSTPAARLAFVSDAKSHLKGIPDADRRIALGELLADLAAPDVEAELGRQMLSWDEVRAARDGTCYGGHSHTHPILSQLEPEAMEREIRTCRDRLAAELGVAPRTFAYPNGRAADFNDLTRELLLRHGFEMAFATIEGRNAEGADRLALRRTHAGGSTVGDFATLVARS
jgi:peptidoglycan/xylan/chitin deacetylase (PgdA/CDA1 family)